MKTFDEVLRQALEHNMYDTEYYIEEYFRLGEVWMSKPVDESLTLEEIRELEERDVITTQNMIDTVFEVISEDSTINEAVIRLRKQAGLNVELAQDGSYFWSEQDCEWLKLQIIDALVSGEAERYKIIVREAA